MIRPRHPEWLAAGGALLLVASAGTTGLWASQGEKRRDELSQQSARAAAATQARDFERAEEEWRKLVTLDPRSAQALHNLGIVCYLEHKYPEAEEALKKALGMDASLTNARVILGASLGREGKLDHAIAELQRALKSRLDDSAESTARVALYDAWFAKGNYPLALEALKPLAEKHPKDVNLLYDLGETYLQLAAQTFGQIELVDPRSYRLHQIVAESLARQGQHRDAIREYQLALEQRPDLPGVHYQVGLLYWLNEPGPDGQSSALKEFVAELRVNPYDAWSEYRLGEIFSRRHEPEKAALHFRRAVELDRTLVPPRLGLARILESQGDLQGALEELEAAEKVERRNAAVHYRLAQLYKKQGNEAASVQHLKTFEEIQAGRQGVQRALERALRIVAEPGTESLDERDP